MVDTMEREASIDTVSLGDGGAFFGEVVREAVDTALGEVLTACLARVRVAVAVVRKLRSSLEILQYQTIRPASHGS
jgi:hypothetical protein